MLTFVFCLLFKSTFDKEKDNYIAFQRYLVRFPLNFTKNMIKDDLRLKK